MCIDDGGSMGRGLLNNMVVVIDHHTHVMSRACCSSVDRVTPKHGKDRHMRI